MAPTTVLVEKAPVAKAKATAVATMDKAKVKTAETAEKVKETAEKVKAMIKSGQGRALVLVKDPQFQTITISSASGAVVLGSVGGAFGTASGIVLGTTAGAVPALFTFGLSLPAGAAMGGASGGFAGTTGGAGIGAVTGGIVGYGGFKYRFQIKDGLVTIQKKAIAVQGQTKVAAGKALDQTKVKVTVIADGVKQRSRAVGQFTKAKAIQLAALPKQAMESDKFKMTAATATAGAAAGCGTGAAVGATAGAVMGLIPAVFTFGLSIPVGAMMGGLVGAASGTVTGAAAGGSVGYGGYTYKKEIRSGASTVMIKVKDNTELASNKVRSSAAQVQKSIKYYSSTGGTA